MPNENYYKLSRSEMLHFLPPGLNSLLDVGCSEGGFGALVKQTFKCTVWGVEPAEAPALEARKKLDKVFNAFFDDSLSIDRQFDAITFNDVLEHIQDPWSTLKKCRPLLSDNGCIVASIPNILYFHDFAGMLLAKDWKYEEAGIFDKTHLRFFTKKSIIRLFEDSGYQVTSIEGIRPTDSKKFTLFNLATFGYWKEARFLQFAVIAKPAL